jgi:hypothetical protein
VVIRIRPLVAGIIGWGVGAALSVGVGLLALSLVGPDLTGDTAPPIAPDALTRPGPTPTTSATTTTPATSTPPPSRTTTKSASPPAPVRLTSRGGYVMARCQGTDAYLVYWSPDPGFHSDEVVRGPARVAMVTFEGAALDVKVRVTCVDGTPRATYGEDEEDDHGAGSG